MSFLSSWTLSVAGIVVIAQLVDIILPEGQTAKYIKSVIAVIIVCVLIQPVTLLKKDIAETTTQEVFINQTFIDTVYLEQIDSLQQEVDLLLVAEFSGVSAKIICSRGINSPKIDYVMVNLQKSVIEKSWEIINLKEEVKTLLMQSLAVNEGQILFYET